MDDQPRQQQLVARLSSALRDAVDMLAIVDVHPTTEIRELLALTEHGLDACTCRSNPTQTCTATEHDYDPIPEHGLSEHIADMPGPCATCDGSDPTCCAKVWSELEERLPREGLTPDEWAGNAEYLGIDVEEGHKEPCGCGLWICSECRPNGEARNA